MERKPELSKMKGKSLAATEGPPATDLVTTTEQQPTVKLTKRQSASTMNNSNISKFKRRRSSIKIRNEPKADDDITKYYRKKLSEHNLGSEAVKKYDQASLQFLKTLVKAQKETLQALLQSDIHGKPEETMCSNPIPRGQLSQLMIAAWSYEIYNQKGETLYYLSELDCIILFNKEDDLEKDQTASKILQLAEMKINLEVMTVEHIYHLEEVLYIRRSLSNNRSKFVQSQVVSSDFDLTKLSQLEFKSQAGKLGNTFIQKSDSVTPSLRQVIRGLKMYHIQKLKEKSRKLGHLSFESHEELVYQYNRAFDTILKLVPTIEDSDQPLIMKVSQTTRGGNIFLKQGLGDPDNPTTQLILWFYTMEPSCREDLNDACRDISSKYVESLGPLACVMFDILQSAEVRRKDRINCGNRFHHPPSPNIQNHLGYFNSSFLLFKGVVMKTEWVMQWIACKNLRGLRDRHNQKLMKGYERAPAFIALQGITSVTDSFRIAMNDIMEEEEQPSHVRVLFVISIQNYRGYAGFRLNKHQYSAHPFERQVLLREGIPMFVADVEAIEIDSTSSFKKLKKKSIQEGSDVNQLLKDKQFWKHFNGKKMIVIHLCNFD